MRYHEINNNIKLYEFFSEKYLIKKLSYDLIKKINHFIKMKNRVNFFTSGGETPINFYKYLSTKSICWSKVNLCLTDERVYEKNFPRRNDKMLVEKLFFKNKDKINFISPYELFYGLDKDSYKRFYKNIFPIDIVLLGMGLDGHIASLIPNSYNLENAIYDKKDCFYLIRNKTNFTKRISLSLSAINKSSSKILFIKGRKKMKILKQSVSKKASIISPVSFLKDSNINVYWCPDE
tara:strand:- start:4884 stop:5588 length:705 start_codon:yes stop_codon:yes gene_type:complete